MAWIELHQSVFTHRKTLELAALLDLPEVYVVGHMTALWCWALDNAPDGILRCSERIIGKIAQWPGKSDEFVSALVECGWLTRSEDGLRIHDWMEYAGKLIERREKDAARKRESRQTQDIPQKSAGHPTDGGVTAYVPNPTQPNHTQQDKTRPEGGVGETGEVSGQVVASWEKILGIELTQGNLAADWLRDYFAQHPNDVLPIAGYLRRKMQNGGVSDPLGYLHGIAQTRASRRAAGEPLEREATGPPRASPNAVPIENVVVPASQSRYKPL